MSSEIDYEWMLRPLLAERGIQSYAELAPLLAEHGVHLSESQVWRIFTGKPERMNLHTLMVLCQILDCTTNDLIKPVNLPVRTARAAEQGSKGVGDLKPKRARIRPARGHR
jgi:DNA-binding Xre family transcriptional regulator